MPDSDFVKEYKCPSCGAPLAYSPENGKLLCGACGNTYEPEAMSLLSDSGSGFDWGNFSQTLNADKLENTVTYICKSCGAEIVTDKTTAATRCPYCDNEIVLSDRLDGGIRPNGIIPFAIRQEEVLPSVRAFFHKKKLLPNNFFTEQKLKNLRPVYVPFWLFSSRIDGSVRFNAVKVRKYVQGNYDVTETSHFLLERDGESRYADIPVDGSTKMDDDLMDSLEPFDFSRIVDFNDAYLAGFLADRFDCNPDSSLPRAEKRMEKAILNSFARTTGGYGSVSIASRRLSVSDTSVRYILLPVYLLDCVYKDKVYRFAVNGQTGRTVGELPISKAKKRLWFWIPFAAAFGVSLLLILYLMQS